MKRGKKRRSLSRKERIVRRIVGPLQYDKAVQKLGISAKIAAEQYAKKLDRKKQKSPYADPRVLRLDPGRFKHHKVPRIHFQKVGKSYVRIETDNKGRETLKKVSLKSIKRTEGQLKYWSRITKISEALGMSKKDAREVDTTVLKERIKALEKFKKTTKYKNMTKAQKRRFTKARVKKQAKRGVDALAGIY